MAVTERDGAGEVSRKLTPAERWVLLARMVLKVTREKAATALPDRGIFRQFGTGLVFPEDEEIRGLLFVEPGSPPTCRTVRVGVHYRGSDRVINNFFFFDSTQEVLQWLQAEETEATLIEVCHHLWQKLPDR